VPTTCSVDVLEEANLAVTRGAYGLDTAFEARAGGGAGPTVAVICEYDALPGIGHACGHNIIAAAGLGAGLAAAAVVDELNGNLVILGTPAEEGGGGKIAMIDAGALEGVDAAMMLHPSSADVESMYAIAIQQLRVTYHGKASHAAAHPELGRNALDAAVLGYNAVAALRQHIAPDERIHGIFTEAGRAAQRGAAPRCGALLRTFGHAGPPRAAEAPGAGFALEGGALSAGCELEVAWVDAPYAELVHNPTLGARYSAARCRSWAGAVAGVEDASLTVGSTDMGNVSLEVPSIHPTIAVSAARQLDPHRGVRCVGRLAGGRSGGARRRQGARCCRRRPVERPGRAGVGPRRPSVGNRITDRRTKVNERSRWWVPWSLGGWRV
jgi:amidohydrolase